MREPKVGDEFVFHPIAYPVMKIKMGTQILKMGAALVSWGAIHAVSTPAGRAYKPKTWWKIMKRIPYPLRIAESSLEKERCCWRPGTVRAEKKLIWDVAQRISNPKSTLYFEYKWVIKMKGEEKQGRRNVPFSFLIHTAFMLNCFLDAFVSSD